MYAGYLKLYTPYSVPFASLAKRLAIEGAEPDPSRDSRLVEWTWLRFVLERTRGHWPECEMARPRRGYRYHQLTCRYMVIR